MNNINNFVIYGISHNELPLLEREEFIKNFRPHKVVKNIISNKETEDVILISTCLRNEFYFWNSLDIDKHFEGIKGLYKYKGERALQHLYEVACGFDSAIPGEDQILAQVKKAYAQKLEKGERPSPLNSIFNKAIALGKKFRTLSKINSNNISVEAIAVKKAYEVFEDLESRQILVVGAGEIANSIVKILVKKGCKNISIIRRRSNLIKEELNFYEFSEKDRLFYASDAIFATTAAPHLIYEMDEMDKNIIKERKRIMVDLAVPRDIDYRLGELDGQKLINLEELNDISGSSLEERKRLCEEHQDLIDIGIEKTLIWFQRRKV